MVYKSTLYKTKAIIEGITGKKVILYLPEDVSEVNVTADGYPAKVTIGLASDFITDEGRFKYPSMNRAYIELEHELSHVLFKSRSIAKLAYRLAGKFTKQFMDVANLFEDERVESLWGAVYKGSRRNFESKNKWFLKRGVVRETDPISALAAVRAGAEVGELPSFCREIGSSWRRSTGLGTTWVRLGGSHSGLPSGLQ